MTFVFFLAGLSLEQGLCMTELLADVSEMVRHNLDAVGLVVYIGLNLKELSLFIFNLEERIE